ncbi:hypothetical protein ScPMuIL_011775 [Solemya velum]
MDPKDKDKDSSTTIPANIHKKSQVVKVRNVRFTIEEMDLYTVKHDFGQLVQQVEPWVLSHFVMWLDIKVAEYKINGLMLLDSTSKDMPRWLRQTCGFKNVVDAEKVHEDNTMLQLSHSTGRNLIHRTICKTGNQRQSKRSFEEETPLQTCHRPRFVHTTETANSLRPALDLRKLTTLQADLATNITNSLQHKKYTNISQPASSKFKSNFYSTDTIKKSEKRLGSDPEKESSAEKILGVLEEPHLSVQSLESLGYVNRTATGGAACRSNAPPVDSRVPDSLSSSQGNYKLCSEKSSSCQSPQQNELVAAKIKIEISDDDEGDSSTNADQSELQTYADELDYNTCTSSASRMPVWSEEGASPHPVKLMPTLPFHARHAVKTDPSGSHAEESAVDNPELMSSLHNSSPIQHSRKLQRVIPFPDRFPIENITFGSKAQEMIVTGEINRAAKMQFLEAIFNELVKYTGLYPTPTQKMSVAKAIVETFPTLAGTCKDSNESPADSWYVTLNDKFRNERRGLVHGEVTRKGKLAKRLHASVAFSKVFQNQRQTNPGLADEGTKLQRLSEVCALNRTDSEACDQMSYLEDKTSPNSNYENVGTWTIDEKKVLSDFEMMTGHTDVLQAFQYRWGPFCESVITAAKTMDVPAIQHLLHVFQSQTAMARDHVSALSLCLVCEMLLPTSTTQHQSSYYTYIIDFDEGPLSSGKMLTDRVNAHIHVHGFPDHFSKVTIEKEGREVVDVSLGIDAAVVILIALHHNLALPVPDIVENPLTLLKHFVMGSYDVSALPDQVQQFAESLNLL